MTFSIRLQESIPDPKFGLDIKKKIDLFEETLAGTDAHATSFQERQETTDHDEVEFTYGEVRMAHLLPLLDFM